MEHLLLPQCFSVIRWLLMLTLCYRFHFSLSCSGCLFIFIFLLDWRARFVLSSNETQAGLKISSLHLADEGLYRCEITYLEINEGCPVVQYVNLTVLGMYIEHFIVFKAKSVHRLSFSDIHRVNCSLPIFSSLCLSRDTVYVSVGEHFIFVFDFQRRHLSIMYCTYIFSLPLTQAVSSRCLFPPSSVFHISSLVLSSLL